MAPKKRRPFALASLIKTPNLTASKHEFYVALCDVLLDLVERDSKSPDALKFSQIAHALAHDLLNLATLAGRLLWCEGVTPNMTRSSDLVAIAVDTETYLISLRTACDILADAFSHFCVEPEKRGQLPKESFRAMIYWAKDNPNRIREDFRFITEHLDWFMELRAFRDKIVHKGYYSNIYTERDLFKFFLMPGGVAELQWLHGGYGGYKEKDHQADKPKVHQVPLLPLLKKFTVSVFELANRLAQAIEKRQAMQASKTHVLSGVYVPAIHHLLSYVEPINRSEQDASEKRRRHIAAWYLLEAGDYLSSVERGYPDGFWWRFLMHLSELFADPPSYISAPRFAGSDALVEWNLVFREKEMNLAVSLRDHVLLKESWLKGVKENFDEFVRRANAKRAAFVANKVTKGRNSPDISNALDFIIVEPDPLIAAEKVFSALNPPPIASA